MLMLIAGCRRIEGPEISVSWKVPKPGLAKGTPLHYESIPIGRVTSVTTAQDGVTIRAIVRWKYAHYVRTKMDFSFQPATGTSNAFVKVISLDKDAPPAPPGAHFEATESPFLHQITTDWKRTGLFCGIGLGFVLVLVIAVRLLFKLWGVILCTVGGAAVAAAFAPIVRNSLAPLLPEGTRVDLLAYLAAFLAGSLVTSLVLGIVVRSFRSQA
jgi:hypothetical protein